MPAHDLAQAPPHPVALDRAADLLRHREAEPRRCRVAALARLQHEGAGRGPLALGGREEVRPLLQPLHGNADAADAADADYALSRLRPRARRALSTLRPPVVAVRARKP